MGFLKIPKKISLIFKIYKLIVPESLKHSNKYLIDFLKKKNSKIQIFSNFQFHSFEFHFIDKKNFFLKKWNKTEKKTRKKQVTVGPDGESSLRDLTRGGTRGRVK